MSNLTELQEQRSEAVQTMKAHAEEGGKEYDAAEKRMKALDSQIARAKAIDEAERRAEATPIYGHDSFDHELRDFSICRAIAGQMKPGSVDDSKEREMAKELENRSGRKAQGMFIPMAAFEKPIEQRTTTSTGGGAAIVPTDYRPEMFINALIQKTVVRALGATSLTGLSGNVSIPRETGSPNIGWVAENSALSSSDASFGSLTLSPKHAGAITSYSRNMVMQSSPAVEQLLRNMLSRDLAIAIDRAAILGGGANEPQGILSTAGIQQVAYDTDLTDTAAEMIALADIANVDAGRGFLTTPEVRKQAMKTKDTDGHVISTAEQFHSEPVQFSNQAPKILGDANNEHALLYGDWSELLIGVWSEIDILVNPYESDAYNKGNVLIRAMATVDCALRHPAAFVSATGVIPA